MFVLTQKRRPDAKATTDANNAGTNMAASEVGLGAGASTVAAVATVQIVIIGRRMEPDTAALLQVVHQRSVPNAILCVRYPDMPLAAPHPAAGKNQVKGKATAYLCRGPTCSLPITDPKGLAQALAHG